jgi:F-type H+-transporting ATPase subunit b
MQIDWLTVIAQIVNFLILVWLLKRFLYQPVINAMDRREQRIAERLQQAEQREQQAAETTQDYQSRIAALEQDKEKLIATAKAEAEAERHELLVEARGEINEKRRHWQHQVDDEKQRFLRSLELQATASVQNIARRALADLADTDLEEQIIESFIRQLKSLDQTSRQTMAAAGKNIQVSTSFELDSSTRSRVTRAVHDSIADNIEVDYKVSPELLCGIELSVAGHRLSWSLADYLDELEQHMQQQLETGNAAAD